MNICERTMKCGAFIGGLIACSSLSAAYDWTFESGVSGWKTANINYIDNPDNPGDEDNYHYISSGFNESNTASSVYAEGGKLLSIGDYAKAPVIGDFSAYLGGTINFTYSETWPTVFSGEFAPNPAVESVLLSGTVGGQKVILRYKLDIPLNRSAGSTVSDTVSIGLLNSDFVNIAVRSEQNWLDQFPTITVDTLTALSDQQFLELLSNLDGIYFRTAADIPTMIDGPEDVQWITAIESVSLLGAVPESSSYSLLFGVAALMAVLVCIRRR